MNDKVFLACFDKGLARAACSPNGDWTVQQLAAGHKINCLTADYGDSWQKLPFNLGGIRFSLLVLEGGGST